MNQDEIYINGVGNVQSGIYKKEYVAEELEREFNSLSKSDRERALGLYSKAIKELRDKR